MDDRSAKINIGGREFELILTTRATKEIAGRYGGLENLGQKLMRSENFEMALDELVWLITLLANQSVLIHNLRNPEDKQELLKKQKAGEQTVVAGVRPVHIEIGDKGIEAKIDVSEMMGSELHLHMNAGGSDVVAVVSTANLDADALHDHNNHSAVKFTFNPRLMHLFNPETERNLF